MKYTIEYEEIVKKINSVVIDVNDVEEGEEIANTLYHKVRNFVHPDDIINALNNTGAKIIEICEGYEDCEYELL